MEIEIFAFAKIKRPNRDPTQVLGEGLEPPQTLRSSGLQPEAIATTRTQRVLILTDFEPSVRFGLTIRKVSRFARLVEPRQGFGPWTCCLQNSCSTTELSRHIY